MNKLFIVHYYPLDYFPPVMNLVDTLQEEMEITVSTTAKNNNLSEYRPAKAQVYRYGHDRRKSGSVRTIWRYCGFTLRTLWRMILEKPDTVLYYESVSAMAPYLYKHFFRQKVNLRCHYHEYMTPEEYRRPGMRISRFNHRFELQGLYSSAERITQTNVSRMNFFLDDYPDVDSSRCGILPNYPPSSWHCPLKRHSIDGVVRCVYVGSLSLHDTYVEEFCRWVAKQNGKVTFDIYSFNFHKEVTEAIAKIDSPYIVFHQQGIPYADIPEVLAGYDVGMLLYKAKSLNFKFNETNKFYEYLACGLDVWYPKEMTLLHEMDKSVFAPQIIEFDFKSLPLTAPACASVTDNSSFNLFAEKVYRDMFDK